MYKKRRYTTQISRTHVESEKNTQVHKMMKECSKIMKEIFSHLSNVFVTIYIYDPLSPGLIRIARINKALRSHPKKSVEKESILVLECNWKKKKVKLFYLYFDLDLVLIIKILCFNGKGTLGKPPNVITPCTPGLKPSIVQRRANTFVYKFLCVFAQWRAVRQTQVQVNDEIEGLPKTPLLLKLKL